MTEHERYMENPSKAGDTMISIALAVAVGGAVAFIGLLLYISL